MTVPPTWPPPPADVDTGFWLWLLALPVLMAGYLVNALASPPIDRAGALYPAVGLIAVLVVAFLILMRCGYRWARTALTGGGVAAVAYAVTGVLDSDQRPAVAITSAVTGIIGSVLVAGGTFLLHRTDAQDYFTR